MKPALFPASPRHRARSSQQEPGRRAGGRERAARPRGCRAALRLEARAGRGAEASRVESSRRGAERSGAAPPYGREEAVRRGGPGWARACEEELEPLLLPADLPMEAAGEPLFPREEVFGGGARPAQVSAERRRAGLCSPEPGFAVPSRVEVSRTPRPAMRCLQLLVAGKPVSKGQRVRSRGLLLWVRVSVSEDVFPLGS